MLPIRAQVLVIMYDFGAPNLLRGYWLQISENAGLRAGKGQRVLPIDAFWPRTTSQACISLNHKSSSRVLPIRAHVLGNRYDFGAPHHLRV